MTRHFGVLASVSKHRNELPDLSQGDDKTQARSGSGTKTKVAKRGHGKRRSRWANSLRRTSKDEVPECPGCGGLFELVVVGFARPTIEATLMALDLPVRDPPIAPARRSGLFGGACVDPVPALTTPTSTEWDRNGDCNRAGRPFIGASGRALIRQRLKAYAKKKWACIWLR